MHAAHRKQEPADAPALLELLKRGSLGLPAGLATKETVALGEALSDRVLGLRFLVASWLS